MVPSVMSCGRGAWVFTMRGAHKKRSIGKIKPLFTRAHPPAPPRTSPVSPLGALPSRTHTPAAGENSVDRQAGRAPSAPHATQSGAGHGQGEKTGATVWACLLQGAGASRRACTSAEAWRSTRCRATSGVRHSPTGVNSCSRIEGGEKE